MRFKELAHRSNHGITVRLFWDARLDRVLLRYRDVREGGVFTAVVPKTEALAAFEHPNAYRPSGELVAAITGTVIG